MSKNKSDLTMMFDFHDDKGKYQPMQVPTGTLLPYHQSDDKNSHQTKSWTIFLLLITFQASLFSENYKLYFILNKQLIQIVMVLSVVLFRQRSSRSFEKNICYRFDLFDTPTIIENVKAKFWLSRLVQEIKIININNILCITIRQI